MAEKFNIVNLANSDGCFDLQFRKDTRHERTNAPTYYRWKAQFVVTLPKNEIKTLEKLRENFQCGEITLSPHQARFSVQKIGDITDVVIPYFRKNCLEANKKKNFELWAKGAEIIYNNKGKPMASWTKSEMGSLLEIHKSSAKYKTRSRAPKWMEMAKVMTQTS